MSAAKPAAAWPRFAADAILQQPPHPYERLAERAVGICLLARLWAQCPAAPTGVRPSDR